MYKRSILGAAAAASVAGLLTITPAAMAQGSNSTDSYQANLSPIPLNGQTSASGTVMLTLKGGEATITENVSGLAATFKGKPFPHVQHIHGLGMGQCPAASADSDGNGVISTPEAKDDYGAIQTTLSTSGDTSPDAGTDTDIAPSGSSFRYTRTIQLNDKTVQALRQGDAEIVVHGLDPATAPEAAGSEKSPLVPSLPLAATAPALCGQLEPAQMGTVPSGAADTGGGATAGVEDTGALAGGAAALALAALTGGYAVNRRRRRTES